MSVLIWILIFAISLYVLIKASDLFIENSEKIGVSMGLSPIIIGVTFLAFGTSLPELLTSIFSIVKGINEIVIANIIGSNITNILLVLGIGILLAKEFKVNKKGDILFFSFSTIFLIITLFDGIFNVWEAIVALAFFGYYITKVVITSKNISSDVPKVNKFKFKFIVLFLFSIVLLYFGAEYTINSLIEISKVFNINADVIAAFAVALGTSLSELVVTVSAVKKKKYELALGNVIGSNIFNVFFVLGFAGLLENLIVSEKLLFLGLPFLIFATLLVFFVTRKKIISRKFGFLFLSLYVLFNVLLFVL